MIEPDALRQMKMLGYLTDEMLQALIPIIDVMSFDPGEKVFSQDDPADRLYLLKTGKVLLEQRISEHVTVSLSAINPGFSFGWSALIEESSYSTDAICAEPSETFSVKTADLMRKMEENHSLGYIINQRLLYVIKKRFDVRTEQFVKTLKLHPEISELL